jgi:hypothetical protein
MTAKHTILALALGFSIGLTETASAGSPLIVCDSVPVATVSQPVIPHRMHRHKRSAMTPARHNGASARDFHHPVEHARPPALAMICHTVEPIRLPAAFSPVVFGTWPFSSIPARSFPVEEAALPSSADHTPPTAISTAMSPIQSLSQPDLPGFFPVGLTSDQPGGPKMPPPKEGPPDVEPPTTTPVPEPSTLTLLFVSAFAVGVLGRRRRGAHIPDQLFMHTVRYRTDRASKQGLSKVTSLPVGWSLPDRQ